jgi:alkylated DNA repair protein (DNA oxidative demethylase)
MESPGGLFYITGIVPYDKDKEIVKKLDEREWKPHSIGVLTSRLVQHYGYYYNYRDYSTSEQAPPMPDFIVELRDIAVLKYKELGMQDVVFNQCIVNNYYPGEGISAHTDAPSFGPVIASFTLGAASEMLFTRGSSSKYSLYVEPGSLYIMSGDSRNKWKHQMPRRTFDVVNNEVKPRVGAYRLPSGR